MPELSISFIYRSRSHGGVLQPREQEKLGIGFVALCFPRKHDIDNQSKQ
jgi:hypothetical protein